MDINRFSEAVASIADECSAGHTDFEAGYSKGWHDACARFMKELSSGKYSSENEESYWTELGNGALECRKCRNIKTPADGPVRFCSECGARMVYIKKAGERKCLYRTAPGKEALRFLTYLS